MTYPRRKAAGVGKAGELMQTHSWAPLSDGEMLLWAHTSWLSLDAAASEAPGVARHTPGPPGMVPPVACRVGTTPSPAELGHAPDLWSWNTPDLQSLGRPPNLQSLDTHPRPAEPSRPPSPAEPGHTPPTGRARTPPLSCRARDPALTCRARDAPLTCRARTLPLSCRGWDAPLTCRA